MKKTGGTAKNAHEFTKNLLADLGITNSDQNRATVESHLRDLLANRFGVAALKLDVGGNEEAATHIKHLYKEIMGDV